MSGLTSLALLSIATGALRARLPADMRVYMQPDQPIDPATPSVAIYAERGTAKPGGTGFVGQGSSQLVLRFDVVAPVDATITPGAPKIRGSSALFLLWRQIAAALSPPSGPWGALWERFVPTMQSVQFAQDLFEVGKGVRIVAYMFEVTVEPLTEPPFGPPNAAWSALLTQMRAEGADWSGMADQIETALAGNFTGDAALAASLGLGLDALASIGLGSSPDPLTASAGSDPGGSSPDTLVASADPSSPGAF